MSFNELVIPVSCRLPARMRRSAGQAGLILPAMALVLALTGCASVGSTTNSSDATIVEAAKLALGTINLEGTNQAVNVELASQLLPLWQLMADMSVSTTAAPEELAAVVDELKTTMTADQLSAIDAMEMPDSEIAAATQGAGTAAAAASGAAGTASQPAQAAMDPALGGELGGDMAGGGMPMDGGAPGPQGSTVTTSNGAKSNPGSSQNAGSNAIFARVITLLESKLQS
jgi:hypothetical protein